MANMLLIPLAALFLEDLLHLSFRMFHDCSVHTDGLWRNERLTAESVISRAQLVYLGEAEDIADRHFAEAGDCEEVLWGEEVAAFVKGRNDVVGRL